MKALSNILKWVGWLVLIASIFCGISNATEAKELPGLVFAYWFVGGGLFCLFSLAQAYTLAAVADIREKLSATPQPAQASEENSSPKEINAGYIICPNCHAKQRDERKTCFVCGAALKIEEKEQ